MNNMNSYVQALQLMGIKYKVISLQNIKWIAILFQDNTLNEVEIASRLRHIRRVMINNGTGMEITLIDAGYAIKL